MNYCSGKGLILYDNYKRKTYEGFRGVALTSHKGIYDNLKGARLILDILHKSLLIYNGTLCFARGVPLDIQAQQLPINELNETPLSGRVPFQIFIGVKG
jgi:hypothetical protein